MQTQRTKKWLSNYMSRIGTVGGSVKSERKTKACHLNGTKKQSTIFLTFQGTTKTLTQWSEALGINRGTLDARHRAGWPIEKILTKPVDTAKPLG